MNRVRGKKLVMVTALSLIFITIILSIFNQFVVMESPPVQVNETPSNSRTITPFDLIES